MSTTTTAPAVSAKSLVATGAKFGAIAAVANVVVFFVGKALGVPFRAKTGASYADLVFLQPLVASFVVILLGSLVLFGLTKVKNGVTIWTAVASIFFVLYTVFAFAASETAATGIALALMHVVGFVVAVPPLRKAALQG